MQEGVSVSSTYHRGFHETCAPLVADLPNAHIVMGSHKTCQDSTFRIRGCIYKLRSGTSASSFAIASNSSFPLPFSNQFIIHLFNPRRRQDITGTAKFEIKQSLMHQDRHRAIQWTALMKPKADEGWPPKPFRQSFGHRRMSILKVRLASAPTPRRNLPPLLVCWPSVHCRNRPQLCTRI